ncbi:MAG: cation diffusion facilitator family transporter [Deltaproteobacteria bacterium]|nr:cation diffusion facilitator family transporter [Deltaproteobacteria bacterium]
MPDPLGGRSARRTGVKSDSRKAIIAAFLANLGIAVAKAIGFFFTGAASMLAESIHSVADTANQGLLLLGSRLARRRETPEHPFGYGRERFFWAFVVALVIFSLGSVFALVEGVEKLLHPHELESPIWAVGILAVAIVLESLSLRTAVRESNHLRGDLSWWTFVRSSKVPELPVVLLEDVGALAGLALALAGVGLALLLEDARFDALGSIAIGLLLGAIAVVLAIEMKSLLIGESASQKSRAALRAIVERQGCVRRLIHMRTEHLGPEELLVAIKVELDGKLDFAAVVSAINALEVQLREAVPIARVVYIEPDIYAEGHEPYRAGDSPCAPSGAPANDERGG